MNFCYFMNLSKKTAGLDTSPIRKAFQMAATLKNPVNLSIGQPHFPCPPNIVEAMCKAGRDGKTSYTLTEGIPELKTALAQKYQTFNKIQRASPDRILVTSGVSSALMLLFNALVDPGDECLIVSPYFLMYPSMLKFNGARTETIHEKFTKEELSQFKNRKFKIIIYSNPSNPTGYIMSREQLEALAELAETTGAWLISDEIYELFDYDNKFISIGSFYDKAITLSGFSKSYNMTGLRLASVLSPPEVHKAIATLQQYTVVCAPAPVQWAGIEALKTGIEDHIADYKNKRDLVYETLKDVLPVEKSAGAFYYYLPIAQNDQLFTERAIKEKELIVVPGFIFSESHEYIRISFATDDITLKKGLQSIKELL